MYDIGSIPFITVCFNTPDLIKDLVRSTRQFYHNKIYILDGSDPEISNQIAQEINSEINVEQIRFNYNIHHGPGMAWAIDNIDLPPVALFIDSDMFIMRPGFLENMYSELKSGMYGVGRVHPVNSDGFDLAIDNTTDGIPYLHPALMLCNTQVMKNWPRPIKHGAPMINAMTAIHSVKQTHLLKHIQWVDDDIHQAPEPSFVIHAGRGTVLRAGSYNLDEWINEMQAKHAPTNQIKSDEQSNAINLNLFKKMNLGCGTNLIQNYLNIGYWIDLSESVVYKDIGGKAGTFMLNHDLVKGIPAQDNTQEVIYHSHFLEHLSYKDGIKLLHEVYDKLTPGGIHRIIVPDMELWIKSYYTKDDFFIEKYRDEVLKDDYEIYTPRGAAFMGMLHNHGHKCGWDYEMLEFHLKRIGFHSIQRCMYQESHLLNEIIELEPYSPLRALESLCIECIK